MLISSVVSPVQTGLGHAKIHCMRWFGPNALVEITDREDGLLVRVTGQRRLIDLVGMGAFLALSAFLFWRDRSWFPLVFVLGASVFSLIYWVGDHEGQLWITEKDIEAIGDLGGISRNRVCLPWSNVSGLEYRQGGEDEPSGLYVRQGGWNTTRVLTHVDKQQAEEIIAAIYRRFPYV
jgi:hypothetical protein